VVAACDVLVAVVVLFVVRAEARCCCVMMRAARRYNMMWRWCHCDTGTWRCAVPQNTWR